MLGGGQAGRGHPWKAPIDGDVAPCRAEEEEEIDDKIIEAADGQADGGEKQDFMMQRDEKRGRPFPQRLDPHAQSGERMPSASPLSNPLHDHQRNYLRMLQRPSSALRHFLAGEAGGAVLLILAAALAMVLGMLVGDFVALPAAVGLSVLFGAMELMLPVMLSGMLSGMVVGMRAATGPMSTDAALGLGASLGLLGLLATYGLNAYIQGKHHQRAS